MLEDELDLAARYTTWNELLQRRAEVFIEDSPQASVFLFSTYDVVSRILDEPEDFGFVEDDKEEIGSIWLDNLHLTSEVHRYIAEELKGAVEAA